VLRRNPTLGIAATIGFLNSETPDAYAAMAAAFRQGLSETGFVNGQNVAIE
jgi:putative ABC transport system substrate-binding protein